MSPKRARKESVRRQRADPGQPGGGKGRRDEPGRTGIWPMSGPLPPGGEARTIGQGELGQGLKGAAGYEESGASELVAYRMDPVCGAQVHPEQAAPAADWNGTTYFFDSDECKRRFEDSPARYATPLARRSA